MHSKVMKALVNFLLMAGWAVALIIAFGVGIAAQSMGIGILVFIISFVIVELSVAREGMKVEQAENIAKIAYNTEQILNMQKSHNNTETNVNDKQSSDSPEVENQINISNWTCVECNTYNTGTHRFCMNCGRKRSY